jgi:hypothetical protein
MQNVTFQTDDDFQGAATTVLPLPAKQIRFERRMHAPAVEPGEL